MSGEKTEQPTAKRLREARRKGQLPRSRMLTSSATTLGGLLGFIAFAPEGFDRLKDWTARLMLEQTAAGAWEEGAWVAARLCGPALGGALAASLAVSVATVGFELDARHAAPKLERINPAAGLKRLFSVRPLLELGKALLVAALLGLIVWNEVESVGADALQTAWLEGTRGMEFLLGRLAALVTRLAWVVLGCGAVDYAIARRRHRHELMMTREEVKREHKESEGDPRHKGQRRALHRQLAQGGPARGVQKATAVIVNPTHIAVALRYDAGECDAPYLVAKGREQDALALKEEARQQGIPVVRDVPLARSLIHFDVGESIPEELYQAAAVVLRTAMELREPDDRPRRQT
ncbi:MULTISPECIES: EscU/YscU/HrcU family type III secretion system export apparatus switch protein [unclassified Corallococcus]|uniref:EscU/YscU/HrcU family type III secretion system export apparatus switch protein n=1 Tax=unclassified Corallococcus TaxID=2685029 RepID=UPI001A8CE583|nr:MULTISPECIES: EscU/YscU/HrcU family type III secretion system export apparatus switch protein [unclassified Corallococcus]MBN9683285.1 EscU/YscU/HrcU family type III secretion system export apparatus switch protein [Corallococcus sp. NCSPR001]WAS85193.1 EscU/YscU/HrcU family type III secretion system export apparatus switch protein [Corallococcus sp. NCRR]